MLRLAALAFTVGLADSLNPSTVGPALYLATAGKRVARVTLFTLGVFLVDLVGGVVLAAAPGRLLIDLLPHPSRTVRDAIELAAGVVLLAVALALWLGRRSLARRALPLHSGGGRSAFAGGASIAAVELPTALPYFAVIAAIVASDVSISQAVTLIALYSLAFVAPLLAIIVVLLIAGERADPLLQRCGAWLQRRWPVVLAALLLLVGSALTVLGGAGLVSA
jgi:cytochrome c biogenesis protein CcdA